MSFHVQIAEKKVLALPEHSIIYFPATHKNGESGVVTADAWECGGAVAGLLSIGWAGHDFGNTNNKTQI